MTNTKKYLLLTVTMIALAAACIGFYLYNKPPLDVGNASGEKVPATKLYAIFAEDSLTAKRNYIHKILEVSGTVTRISENQQHQQVVLLKTNTGNGAINCTLEGPAKNIKAGQTVAIKGICNGMGEGDADLGLLGDIYIIRCYVLDVADE